MLVLLPKIFFIVLLVSVFSALSLLNSRISLSFVRIHMGILSLPPIVALLALISHTENIIIGPWRFNSLSWLLSLFVLTIGLMVQRYSMRYLFGDRSYRKYFALLTFTTAADTLAWLSNDLRLLLICWGATLFGLVRLIRLNKEWMVARNAATLSGRLFAMSWSVLFIAIIWLAQATGHWQLSLVLNSNSLAQLHSWEKIGINLLLVLAVVIPAAQWPFQRWLLESVVAPTPISAVMHAGIVNAGGMLLTVFAPLFSSQIAQTVLLALSSISVLIGTGMMLVQVDYKRQLVGSTIAQMGFMLIQCALGAYLAAIIHAVLHGLFKSTLFLQAGSAINYREPRSRTVQSSSLLWNITGIVLGILVGVGFWLTAPQEEYQWISAVILGWSVSLAWTQLVAFGQGHIGRIAGLVLFIGVALVFRIIHSVFYSLLHETILKGVQPPTSVALFLLFILLGGGAAGFWLSHNRSSKLYAVLYLWLVRFSEPRNDSVESHPGYLTKIMFRGDHV